MCKVDTTISCGGAWGAGACWWNLQAPEQAPEHFLQPNPLFSESSTAGAPGASLVQRHPHRRATLIMYAAFGGAGACWGAC